MNWTNKLTVPKGPNLTGMQTPQKAEPITRNLNCSTDSSSMQLEPKIRSLERVSSIYFPSFVWQLHVECDAWVQLLQEPKAKAQVLP